MREDQARVQLQAAADAAAVRGSLLFHLDLATALAAGALAEAGLAAEALVPLVDAGGYGVLALDDAVVSHERAVVRFAADGRPLVTPRAGAAAPQVAARARAAATVAAAGLTRPHRQAVIAIPQADAARVEAELEVYALALPDAPGDVVLGIHWHARTSADGASLAAREPLSRTALVLPSRREQPPFGVEVTHFGAVPSEIHTWLSLKHGVTFTVATLESGLTWSVEAERTILTGRA